MYGSPYFGEDGKLVVNDEAGVKSSYKTWWLEKSRVYKQWSWKPFFNDVLGLFQNQKVAISFANNNLMMNIKADMEAGKVGNLM